MREPKINRKKQGSVTYGILDRENKVNKIFIISEVNRAGNKQLSNLVGSEIRPTKLTNHTGVY